VLIIVSSKVAGLNPAKVVVLKYGVSDPSMLIPVAVFWKTVVPSFTVTTKLHVTAHLPPTKGTKIRTGVPSPIGVGVVMFFVILNPIDGVTGKSFT